MSRLVNLEWNVFTGHDPADVRETLIDLSRQHRPHVITVLEAVRQDLSRFPGYQLLQEAPRPVGPAHLMHEEGETALLIRNDVKITHQRISPMTEPWTGPRNDWPHDPRRYRSAWLRLPDGVLWKYQGAHWPTGGFGGRNDAAVTETVDFAEKWLRRTMPGRPTALVGDVNFTKGELGLIADSGRADHVGAGLDHALFRNCTATFVQLGQFRSDHNANLFVFNH